MSRPPKAKKASPRHKSSTGKRASKSPGIDPRQVDWVSDVASMPAQKPPRQARGKRKVVDGEDGKLRLVLLTAEQAQLDREEMNHSRSKRAAHRQGGGPRKGVAAKVKGELAETQLQRLRKVQTMYPGNFKRQLLGVCDDPIPAQCGRPRFAGDDTTRTRRAMLSTFADDLRKEGIRLTDLDQLSAKHVHRVVQAWRARGVSASTMSTWLSHLRVVMRVVGRSQVVPATDQFAGYPGELRRRTSALVPKGWRPKGVDPAEVFARVKKKCLHAWHILRMCAAFGLRAKEGVRARPAQMVQDGLLSVEDGTKGRRPRTVPILTEDQREVLRAAADFSLSPACRKGTLIRQGYTVKQDQRRLYYVLSACGITADELGVTVHGLRHDYLNTRFEQIAGVPSPVVGGVIPVSSLPKDVLRHAEQTVAHEAGHARRSISRAYLGSVQNIKRNESQRMHERLHQIEYHAPTVAWLHSVGAGEWFIVGDHAMGRLPLGKRTQLTLAGTIKRLDLVLDGARALKERLGFPVQVVDISTVDPEAPRLELVSLSLISPANEPVLGSEPNASARGGERTSQEDESRPHDEDDGLSGAGGA
ncbi:phage integrase N-terminal domain-containing protein [Piscinibacterium candidicorallinum]|uniref:Phage integrase N-terminal domain-containing protein n=1 Tax=Piscinibacterium candidicorallinum TaxID=1793872 RepID=A0ABV7H885_9BURK